MSDQTFDFLCAARGRAHQIVFTGINEILYGILKQNLTLKLMEFLVTYKKELWALGEKNKKLFGKDMGVSFL